MNMLLATLQNCLRYSDAEWVCWITEQDLPALSPDAMVDQLESRDVDLNIMSRPRQQSPWPDRESTVRFDYRYPVITSSKYVRQAVKFLGTSDDRRAVPGPVYLRRVGETTWIGLRNRKSHVGDRLRCGHMWFTARRSVVEYWLEYVRSHQELIRSWRRMFMPCESALQTIAATADWIRVSDDNLRYVKWPTVDSPRPAVLDESDLPEILSGKYHFARKFDARSSSDIGREVLRQVGLTDGTTW